MIDGVNTTGNTITKLIDGRLHGFPKIFEVSYSPVVVDGVIARLISTFVDLTEYHRLLEENDAILNQLENTEGFKRFAYFRVEKNGANYEVYASSKIRSILGLEGDSEYVYSEFLSPDTVVHSFDYKKNVLSLLDGFVNKVSFTFSIRNKNGERRFIEMIADSVNAGDVIIGYFNDVTQREQDTMARIQQLKEDALMDITAGTAHNLITRLRHCLELLRACIMAWMIKKS